MNNHVTPIPQMGLENVTRYRLISHGVSSEAVVLFIELVFDSLSFENDEHYDAVRLDAILSPTQCLKLFIFF